MIAHAVFSSLILSLIADIIFLSLFFSEVSRVCSVFLFFFSISTRAVYSHRPQKPYAVKEKNLQISFYNIFSLVELSNCRRLPLLTPILFFFSHSFSTSTYSSRRTSSLSSSYSLLVRSFSSRVFGLVFYNLFFVVSTIKFSCTLSLISLYLVKTHSY